MHRGLYLVALASFTASTHVPRDGTHSIDVVYLIRDRGKEVRTLLPLPRPVDPATKHRFRELACRESGEKSGWSPLAVP